MEMERFTWRPLGVLTQHGHAAGPAEQRSGEGSGEVRGAGFWREERRLVRLVRGCATQTARVSQVYEGGTKLETLRDGNPFVASVRYHAHLEVILVNDVTRIGRVATSCSTP